MKALLALTFFLFAIVWIKEGKKETFQFPRSDSELKNSVKGVFNRHKKSSLVANITTPVAAAKEEPSRKSPLEVPSKVQVVRQDDLRTRQVLDWFLQLENRTKLYEDDFEKFEWSGNHQFLVYRQMDGSEWLVDEDTKNGIRRIQIRYSDGRLIGKIYKKDRLQQMSYQDHSGNVFHYQAEDERRESKVSEFSISNTANFYAN